MDESTNKATKLLSQRAEEKLLAICSITGIAITLDIPSIPGFALDYENPLARIGNAVDIANILSTKDLVSLGQPVLSGILLTILKHHSLMNCPLTSAAQNLSLCSIHPNTLVASIRFFAKLERRDIKHLPHLSLVPMIEGSYYNKETSITSVVKNYTKVCTEIIFPSKEVEAIQESYKQIDKDYSKENNKRKAEAILRARRTREMVQMEIISSGRKIIKELEKEEGVLSPKLLALLKILFTKDYLLTAEISLKDRISTALLKREGNEKCRKLVSLINDKATNSEIESIFSREEDKEVEEKIDSIEAELPVLSFKERLALKTKKAEEKAEEKEEGK